MNSFKTNPITFSANDLAEYFGVDRQTIYRMRATSRLPNGFLIGQRIRRWSLTELVNHSDELKLALLPLVQPSSQPANDNWPE
jgi:predicted DNA-binding transcriptional regulator AlpA